MNLIFVITVSDNTIIRFIFLLIFRLIGGCVGAKNAKSFVVDTIFLFGAKTCEKPSVIFRWSSAYG